MISKYKKKSPNHSVKTCECFSNANWWLHHHIHITNIQTEKWIHKFIAAADVSKQGRCFYKPVRKIRRRIKINCFSAGVRVYAELQGTRTNLMMRWNTKFSIHSENSKSRQKYTYYMGRAV
jgi:hypothetical protein